MDEIIPEGYEKSGRQMSSAFGTPQTVEILNLWAGFKEVDKFIGCNGIWLDGLMKNTYI